MWRKGPRLREPAFGRVQAPLATGACAAVRLPGTFRQGARRRRTRWWKRDEAGCAAAAQLQSDKDGVTLCAASQGALDAVQCNDNFVCGPLSAQQVYANAGAGTSSDGSVLFDGARRSRSQASGCMSVHAPPAGSRCSPSSGRNCAPAQTNPGCTECGELLCLALQQRTWLLGRMHVVGRPPDFLAGMRQQVCSAASRWHALESVSA